MSSRNQTFTRRVLLQARSLWWRRWPAGLAFALALPPLGMLAGLWFSSARAQVPIPWAVAQTWRYLFVVLVLEVPVFVAVLLAEGRERGVAEQQRLAGTTTLGRVGPFGCAVGLLVALVCLLTLSVSATLAALWSALSGGSVEISGGSWASTLPTVGAGLPVTVLFCVVVGALCAVSVNTRWAAVLASLVVTAGPQVLYWVGFLLPSVRSAYAVTPVGALDALAGSGALPSTASPIAAAFLAAELALGVVAAIASHDARFHPRVPRERPRGRARGSRRHLAVTVGASAALAVTIGAIVPVAARQQVPWDLRPSWLLAKAQHRTSKDVALRFVRDLREGRVSDAAGLTTSTNLQRLLGPFFAVVNSGEPVSATVATTPGGNPGQVELSFPTVGFSLCERIVHGRWVITEATSRGSCPEQRFG